MSSILFVCTGNICRSPSADALLRHRLKGKTHIIDSAGTHGYHIGERIDDRAAVILQKKGVSTQGLFARKVDTRDFTEFDFVIAMDRGHFKILQKLQPDQGSTKLSLFSDFCSDFKGEDVPDPYYGGKKDFEYMVEILEDGIEGIIRELL